MVFFFKARTGHLVYMGRDKYENEDLIAYGWPEDIWFHVSGHSSAHVYARLNPGETMDTMPQELIEDCCQLVKSNSIEGCKLASVGVEMTPWSNLRKDQTMSAGQVGIHNNKLVKIFTISRDRVLEKRILKTKEERIVDLKAERQQRDHEELLKKKKETKERKIRERKEMEAQKQYNYERSYDRIFENDDQKTYVTDLEGTFDVSAARNFEDDFM